MRMFKCMDVLKINDEPKFARQRFYYWHSGLTWLGEAVLIFSCLSVIYYGIAVVKKHGLRTTPATWYFHGLLYNQTYNNAPLYAFNESPDLLRR